METGRKYHAIDTRRIAARLHAWFNVEAGRDIRDAELEMVAAILPNLFGYHIVQLGNQVSDKFLTTTRISHSVLIGNGAAIDEEANIVGRCDALPLMANAIDVLVAPHVLEFADEPHAVLREAERVLIGEGFIVIVGFNPWSLCGLWQLLAGWRGKPPWSGQFLSASRITDWLKLLGFEIEFLKKTSFRPPLRRESITGKLRFMELLGTVCWPFFGNVYVVLAKKRVAAVTPLKASWQTRRRMMAGKVAEPTTRAGENKISDLDPAP
jgi:SAM-dependent methyltransferase